MVKNEESLAVVRSSHRRWIVYMQQIYFQINIFSLKFSFLFQLDIFLREIASKQFFSCVDVEKTFKFN